MNPRRCAMSLIEVTLAILVVGLLAAVAAPRFADSVRMMELEAAAQQLAAHIDLIRQTAINEGRTTSLVCDNNRSVYQCTTVDFAERVGETILVSLPADHNPAFTLQADFDGASTLSFDFEGTPLVGSTPLVNGTITLQSGRGEQFVITIAAGTGASSLTRGNGPVDSGGGDAQELESIPEVDGESGASA